MSFRSVIAVGVLITSSLISFPAHAQTAVLQFGNDLNVQLAKSTTAGEFVGTVYVKGADPKDYGDTSVTVSASPNFEYIAETATRIKITNTQTNSIHHMDFEIKDNAVQATLKDNSEKVVASARLSTSYWSVDLAVTGVDAAHVFLANLFIAEQAIAVTFEGCVASAVGTCGSGKVMTVTYTSVPNMCSFTCKP